MKINTKFKSLLKDPELKFTIILGSGFHLQAKQKDSILSSWEMLLQKLSPDCKLTKEYHLDFEKIIESKKIPCEDSNKTEERLLECVKKLLQTEQERVLENCASCYPVEIFNPKYVSDVISLNFDEIPEILLKRHKKIKDIKNINDSSFSKQAAEKSTINKNSYGYLTTKHKSVEFNNGDKIRFWYPHGNIDKDSKIILGLHRYSQMLEASNRMRNHHMQHKRLDKIDNTWYFRIIDNPVLILGAGLSPTEWDIWYALVSRNRANDKKHPIFQMRECECKNDAQHQWFEPLFTGMKFDEQWKKLEKLFKS